MQDMSAPHDLQPSNSHHAVIIRTEALVNTQAWAWMGYCFIISCMNLVALTFTFSLFPYYRRVISMWFSSRCIIHIHLLEYRIFSFMILYSKKNSILGTRSVPVHRWNRVEASTQLALTAQAVHTRSTNHIKLITPPLHRLWTQMKNYRLCTSYKTDHMMMMTSK